MAEESRQGFRLTRADYLAAGIDRGMRMPDGAGILVGITGISDYYGSRNGQPCDGRIYYRGHDLCRLAADPAMTYEGICFLLLTGRLPGAAELHEFAARMSDIRRERRDELEEIIIREGTGSSIMNMTARCILGLYDCDHKADDTSWENMVRQLAEIIAVMPVITTNLCMLRQVGREHFRLMLSEDGTAAENILYILRGGNGAAPEEVRALDQCLMLHAELGGSNNSAFTTRVVSSSGTDTYAAIASAICSIKGPKHGGANACARDMMQYIGANVQNYEDEDEVMNILTDIVRGTAYDGKGLLYGMGHAVFTKSDPRTVFQRELARRLAVRQGREREFGLYALVERLGPEAISRERHTTKPVSANVDFYSGFVYGLLGIPTDLFTPLFVDARIAGWSVHRLEEMSGGARIMHPDVRYVARSGRG